MPRIDSDQLTGLLIAGVAWIFLMTIILAAALTPEGRPKTAQERQYDWQQQQLDYCKNYVKAEDRLDCMRTIDATEVHN